MYGPIGHGFGGVAAVFAAIVWSIGVLVLLLVIIALAVLLARFLWVGTKVAQRYLELNGSPTPRPRATAPTATSTTTPASTTAPASSATTTTTTPVTKPRAPKPPAA